MCSYWRKSIWLGNTKIIEVWLCARTANKTISNSNINIIHTQACVWKGPLNNDTCNPNLGTGLLIKCNAKSCVYKTRHLGGRKWL